MSRILRGELLPLALLVAVIVADHFLGKGHSASTLVVIAPLLASSLVGPRLTAAYGVLSMATWVLLGFLDDQFTTPSGRSAQLVRGIGIVIGALIAVAAAEARLRREERLRRVERVAEVAQRAILADVPSRIGSLTVAARYESSAQDATVGGDFYSALPTQFGSRVLIGDVRGNGLEAVRLAAAVLGAFRERADEERDLVDLLERLDAAVVRIAANGDFVTALIVQITDAGQLTLVSAGHLPPALIRAGEASLLLPDDIRPPLGLAGRAVPVELRLLAGDRLLLHTDGATEARRPHDRAFRPDSAVITDALAGGTPAEMVQSVFAGLLEWSQGQLTDDVAVLTMQYEPAPLGARVHDTV